MEHAEVVLKALEKYEEGRYEIVGGERWEDIEHEDKDPVKYDEETTSAGDDDVECEMVVCMVYGYGFLRNNDAILLRCVGKERKDGTAYADLDEWLPKKVFRHQRLWGEREQVEMIQRRWCAVWSDKLYCYYVRRITDE